jgi:hypothetical protein
MLFRILFGIDTAAALVVLGFFVVGIDDGTVSSLNIQMWLGMLGGIVLVLAGGLIAKAKGQRALASAMLATLAVPVALCALFVLAVVIFQPRWN